MSVKTGAIFGLTHKIYLNINDRYHLKAKDRKKKSIPIKQTYEASQHSHFNM
jgi:plasmid maintenance system antidote protein VapI